MLTLLPLEIAPDVSIRPPEVAMDVIALLRLLAPTIFNLSHSALFIDDDTKTFRWR